MNTPITLSSNIWTGTAVRMPPLPPTDVYAFAGMVIGLEKRLVPVVALKSMGV
jgi:hypothetical protein